VKHLDAIRTREKERYAKKREMALALREKWEREHPECVQERLEQVARKKSSDQEKRNKDRIERGRKDRIFLRAYLSHHPCVDCGEKDPIVLEFDHVKGNKKNAVSQLAGKASLATISKEIEKCVVRCANCHRRRHAKERGYYRVKT